MTGSAALTVVSTLTVSTSGGGTSGFTYDGGSGFTYDGGLGFSYRG
jgi:hypothetical protein